MSKKFKVIGELRECILEPFVAMPVRPKWTNETPTEAGWYGVQRKDDWPKDIVCVVQVGFNFYVHKIGLCESISLPVFVKNYPEIQWYKIELPTPPKKKSQRQPRLIVASPELLEAAEAVLDAYGKGWTGLERAADTWNKLKTAVAKAKGDETQ